MRISDWSSDVCSSDLERLAEKAHTDVARGIIRGNMLAYASPASAKMADIVIAAFKEVPPDTMEGVRVVFIGDAADGQRVQAAGSPAGVTSVFAEAKGRNEPLPSRGGAGWEGWAGRKPGRRQSQSRPHLSGRRGRRRASDKKNA